MSILSAVRLGRRFNRDIVVYMLSIFFLRGLFTQSIIIYYFLELGYSHAEVSILFAAYGIAVILSQLPAGFLSDTYSRHGVLAFWGIFAGVGTLLPLVNTSFASLMVAEIFCGFGVGFGSGKETAYLYDYLVADGREREYPWYYSCQLMLENIMFAGAGFVGGYLSVLNIRMPFYLTLGSLSVATCLILSLPRRQPAVRIEKFYRAFRACSSEVIRWPLMTHVMALSLLVAGGFSFFFWLFQPYVDLIDADSRYLGLIYLLFYVVMAWYVRWIPQIYRRWSFKYIISMHGTLLVAQLVALALFQSLSNVFAVALLFAVGYNFRSYLNIIINEHVCSAHRAMYLSMLGTVEYVGYIFYFLLHAYLTKHIEFQQSLLYIAIVASGLLAVLALFMVNKKKIFSSIDGNGMREEIIVN